MNTINNNINTKTFNRDIRTDKIANADKLKKLETLASETQDIGLLQKKNRVGQIYDKICSVINLNQQLKPKLEFLSKGMNIAAFANTTAKIYIDDSILKLIDYEDAVFIIRHELEHVKQFHNIMRMLGIKDFSKLITKNGASADELGIEGIDIVNVKYYQKVEQILGKIDKNSREGFITQKYIDAFNQYPDLMGLMNRKDIGWIKKHILFIKEYLLHYRFNLLEREANKAAAKFVKTFKL